MTRATPSGGGLLQAWFTNWLSTSGLAAGQDPTVAANRITDELRNNLLDTWDKLKTSLAHGGADEIAGLCSDTKNLVSTGGAGKDYYLQNLCKAIVEIRYFTSGGGTQKNGALNFDRTIGPHEWHPRCIVGAVALSTIYGDHCQLEEVIGKIESTVEGKLKNHLNNNRKQNLQAQLDICKKITNTDLMLGKALLHDKIKQWTKENREKADKNSGPWRIRMPWSYWKQVCTHSKDNQEELQRQRRDNASVMTSFLNVGNSSRGATIPGQLTIEEVLTNPDYKLEPETLQKVLKEVIENGSTNTLDATNINTIAQKLAEASQDKQTDVCLKNSNGDLCKRIQCLKTHWQATKGQSTVQAGATLLGQNFWNDAVKPELEKLFKDMTTNNSSSNVTTYCSEIGKAGSTKGEACKHIVSGLEHISKINDNNNNKNDGPLKRTMACAALNVYADQLIEKSPKQGCTIDETTIGKMFNKWNGSNNNSLCQTGVGNTKDCFTCERKANFTCNLNNSRDDVQTKVKGMLNNDSTGLKESLDKICKPCTGNFCERLKCVADKWRTNHEGQSSQDAMKNDIDKELKALLGYMTQHYKEANVASYCNSNTWLDGSREGYAKKAACQLTAAGLDHLYSLRVPHQATSQKNPFDNQEFRQTISCLLLRELAKKMKQTCPNSREGIKKAFGSWDKIKGGKCKTEPCIECNWDNDNYETCKSANDEINPKVDELFTNQTNKILIERALEQRICPILPTDILTPFLPLAPVSIGLSVMAYYLWKYFGPLGKGGPRFRRSPAEIPGPSVQEQVLDHVEEAGPHEYQLVKERKPPSVPARTKRSGRDPAGGGRVNRRTIIEIHFEVLDECQKGNTQLNEKDFLELLVREFMGSQLMEEEQILMEEVPLESLPMERVSIEEVPILGSRFKV